MARYVCCGVVFALSWYTLSDDLMSMNGTGASTTTIAYVHSTNFENFRTRKLDRLLGGHKGHGVQQAHTLFIIVHASSTTYTFSCSTETWPLTIYSNWGVLFCRSFYLSVIGQVVPAPAGSQERQERRLPLTCNSM